MMGQWKSRSHMYIVLIEGYLPLQEIIFEGGNIQDKIWTFKPATRPEITRRWTMKVSNAVNLVLDYHKLNSQKKYDQGV
jgi:hypothetical protein